jgi:hypothetical protein
VQLLTITFLLTIYPCSHPENRHGSCQVFSENDYQKQQLLLQVNPHKRGKARKQQTLGQTKNHLPTKFLLSIDGV